MIKKAIIGMLFIALIATIIPAPALAYSYEVEQGTITYGVNFRPAPTTSNQPIRMLQRGEEVEIIERVNANWLKIKDKHGQTGYISSSNQYIEISSKRVQPEPNAVIVRSVNFRTGPSTSNSSMRFLRTGEPVWILEQVNSYWYKASDENNVIGYVSTKDQYVQLTGEIPSPNTEEPETIAPEKPQSNAVIVRAVNFRTGPSTNNSSIRFLQKGEEVMILEQVNSYWYKVQDQNDRVGYVSTNSKYIDSSYEPPYVDLDDSQAVEQIINAGMAYWGTPYEFGSNRNSTLTFDCSAFVRRAFMDAVGLILPSNSRTQADYVRNVGKTSTDLKQLKRGDLLFFMDYLGTSKSNYSGINVQNQRISHVGIYLGNGQMLHTYSVDSGGVRIDTIENRHWEYRLVIGGSAF